jgi:hypothetical protein
MPFKVSKLNEMIFSILENNIEKMNKALHRSIKKQIIIYR